MAVNVDAEDKRSVSLHLRGKPPVLVNEAGLYSLILRSRQVKAVAFKRWVTSEVLPAIRRNGLYMTKAVAVEAVEDPATFMARAVLAANDQINRLKPMPHGLDPDSLQTLTVYDWCKSRDLTRASWTQSGVFHKTPTV